MRTVTPALKLALLSVVAAVAFVNASAQLPICPPRPPTGTQVQNPLDLYSQNGVLSLDLTMQNEQDPDGTTHYCYNYLYQGQKVESPSLRLNPGDQLILNLTNNLQAPFFRYPYTRKFKSKILHPIAMHEMSGPHKAGTPSDPCAGGEMLPSSTNLHFHGLNVPPVCHQDEIIHTIIQSGDPAFQYNLRIPANEPPGMYWYHPHVHGNTFAQVSGGASGAIFVEGSNPLTDGLTEHVIVMRQSFPPGQIGDEGPSTLSINYQPIIPNLQLPYISAQPGHQEFWRVLNSTGAAIFNIQIRYAGIVQPLEVIAKDGVPLMTPTNYSEITLPPAARVEFIVPSLPAGQTGVLQTNGFDSGPIGDRDPPLALANIKPLQNNDKPAKPQVSKATPIGTKRFGGLKEATVTAQRALYFSEETISSNGPLSLFITVVGQRPHVFHMDDPPAITTTVGAVEDWTVENRSGEAHVFHMHQIHFLLLAINGVTQPNPDLIDTVTVPAWTGSGPYPSITMRMDFRDPNIAGTFVYHCHILDHEDGGMMAKIQVNPN